MKNPTRVLSNAHGLEVQGSCLCEMYLFLLQRPWTTASLYWWRVWERAELNPFPLARGLLVMKGWGKAGQWGARAEVGAVPKSAPVVKVAVVPGHGASGVWCLLVCSSVALKTLGLSEIVLSALYPFVFEAVSVCDWHFRHKIWYCSCDAAPDLAA